MKKIILMLLLVFSSFIVIKAQQNDISTTGNPMQSTIAFQQGKTFLSSNYPANENAPTKDYDYYNHKCHNNRIIGLSLLGAGIVSGVAGILVVNSGNYATDYETANRNDEIAAGLFVCSAATGIASIPFMILAHYNKTKARAALSAQKAYIPGKATKNITGFTVFIPIGK